MADTTSDHTVYIVHCTDAEGPLHESLEATFERVYEIFDLEISPSQETLRKLQRCELDLGGLEKDVARVVHPGLIDYNNTWDKIDAMLERIMSKSFREAMPDSQGGRWVYNWFCVDHIGYTINPRRKDCGYHNIFDHYRRVVEGADAPDGVHFHFHPSHPLGASHRSATFYFHDLKFFQVLARRIIDRGWFPSVNRAGFQTERPDSHWLLEQWIPFDISNMSSEDIPSSQLDFGGGVSGDWRRAPSDWIIYNPAHDDYQVPGNCRRYIGRCLHLGTRLGLLDEVEVRKAFERARREGATLLAFADHDFRDISENVTHFQNMLRKVIPDYPDVGFRYCEAREAFNRVLFGDYKPPEKNILSVSVDPDPRSSRKQLTIKCSEPSFGPQPFLAIRTRSGAYHHDNLDFQEPFRSWTYLFHADTFDWDDVDCVGVATNDRHGFPHVVRLSRREAEESTMR